MCEIAINLIFEDSLSGSVLQKLVANSRRNYLVGFRYSSGGYGWIKKRINAFNKAAKGMPYLVLTDLDRSECPPVLIRDWLTGAKHRNLLFRVAVRQVESWLLACRENFAQYLGIKTELIPSNVDEIPDAKRFVINLARKSRRRQMRQDIVPEEGSTAKIGPGYNGRFIYFVENLWNPNVAKRHSQSLLRTIEILDDFNPIFESPL